MSVSGEGALEEARRLCSTTCTQDSDGGHKTLMVEQHKLGLRDVQEQGLH